ncbi:MAG TPA: NRDE family protein [Chloroflexota bacterium]|jgi:hypothetical protein
MCTIITLFQVHPAYPLVIAANRDERYARPSSGPALLEQPLAVVAGRDLEFGGTWFGVNAQGVAVAVADQGLTGERRGRPPQLPNNGGSPTSGLAEASGGVAREERGDGATVGAKRSRGLLVLDALGCPSVTAVSAMLDGVAPADYNPFTLLHADAEAAAIGRHADGPIERRALGPGLDVMVSAIGADHARWRSDYVLGALQPARLAALDVDSLRAELTAVLRHHAANGDRDDAICRHHEESGTVSSFVALLAPDLAVSQLHCAFGAPCRAPYADYSHLLRDLAAARV